MNIDNLTSKEIVFCNSVFAWIIDKKSKQNIDRAFLGFIGFDEVMTIEEIQVLSAKLTNRKKI